jgi:hypothetical protein
VSGELGSFIERTNLPLTDQAHATTIVNAFPKILGVAPVKITFGSHDYAGSPIRWAEPVTFTPGQNRKLDIRTTGVLHAYKVESIGVGLFSIGGMEVAFVKAGER